MADGPCRGDLWRRLTMPIASAGRCLPSMRGEWRRRLRMIEPEGTDTSEPVRSRDGPGPIECRNGGRRVTSVSTHR
jgi:hypothetical protein